MTDEERFREVETSLKLALGQLARYIEGPDAKEAEDYLMQAQELVTPLCGSII